MAALEDADGVAATEAATGDALLDALTATVQVDRDGTGVIRVEGELDTATNDVVRSAINSAIGQQATRLVFEMSGVGFMDSSGLAVLLEGATLVSSVQIRGASNAVRRVIEITGLTEVLPIVE